MPMIARFRFDCEVKTFAIEERCKKRHHSLEQSRVGAAVQRENKMERLAVAHRHHGHDTLVRADRVRLEADLQHRRGLRAQRSGIAQPKR